MLRAVATSRLSLYHHVIRRRVTAELEGAIRTSFADTIDAMTTDRPYRAALDAVAVRKELLRFRGTQFDPGICDALLRSALYSKLFPAAVPEASDWVHTTPERGSVLRAAVS